MNVTCPNCATIYRVDPAKVPEAGVRARCAVCNAVFAVRREVEQGTPTPTAKVEPARPEPAASRPEPPRVEPLRPIQPPVPPAWEPPPAPKVEPSRPAAPAGISPRGPASPAAPGPAGPAQRPASPAAPASPGAPSRPAAPARPAAGPAAVPPAAPPAPAARPAAPAPDPARTGAATPPASKPAGAAGSRPTNPFLSQDPTLKAKRLARALISDMVVYHPGKRQEGLRDGNLKELFEEEIKKSYDEYADQVGREVAESTNYFREALNEILAGGRQLF